MKFLKVISINLSDVFKNPPNKTGIKLQYPTWTVAGLPENMGPFQVTNDGKVNIFYIEEEEGGTA